MLTQSTWNYQPNITAATSLPSLSTVNNYSSFGANAQQSNYPTFRSSNFINSTGNCSTAGTSTQHSSLINSRNSFQSSESTISHFLRQRKAKWSPKEDKKLLEAIDRLGTESWIRIAQLVPGRNSKQCRERWMGQLCPSIVKTSWTREEDEILIQQHYVFGNKWTLIATMLPGRSAINVKNRWSRLKRHNPKPNAAFMSEHEKNMNSPSLAVYSPSSEGYSQKSSMHTEYSISDSSDEISSPVTPKSGRSDDVVVLPHPNFVFEAPPINSDIFGEGFLKFQQQMLM